MAQTKTLNVAIQSGMRQDVSPRFAPPGTLVDAVNVRFGTAGEVEARPGTTALSAANDCDVSYSDVASAGLGVLQRTPYGFFVGCDGFGFSFDAATNRLHAGGTYSNAEPLGVFATVAREEMTNTGRVPWPLSQAAVNGYVAIVYSCGNGQGSVGPGDNAVHVAVFTESGVPVATDVITSATAALLVRDHSTSTDLILVTQNTTTGISARRIITSATGATIGSPTNIATLNNASCYWAACSFPGIGWLLVHQDGAGQCTINAFAALVSVGLANFVVTGTVPVSIFADSTNVYVGFRDGSTAPYSASARVYDTALMLTSPGTVVIETENDGEYIGPPLFGPSNLGSRAIFAIARWESTLFDDSCWTLPGELTSAGVNTNGERWYQAAPASSPFGGGYIWVVTGSGSISPSEVMQRLLLVDMMGRRESVSAVFAAAQPVIALSGNIGAIGGSNYSLGLFRHHLATPVQFSDGTWMAGTVRIVRDESKGTGFSPYGLGLAEWLRFRVGGSRQSTQLGAEVLVSGWPTLAFSSAGTRNNDGLQRDGIDIGFPVYPGMAPPIASNALGALTSSATYQYRAVVERIDHLGRRWRSPASPVVTGTTGASDNTITLGGYCNVGWFRARPASGYFTYSDFVMHFYRTEANGSTFYRCTPAQGAPAATGNVTFAFTDELSDDALRTREVLYTDGGVLNNDAPASCRFIRASEDRVWLGGLWEPEQLQSSKILVPGEPPQFSDHPAFRVVLPEVCTGIAIQDGVLFAFARSAIYAVQGTGPNDQGQGAWDTPRSVTRSTGCINASSIVETSIGIFFQSAQGIELMPRGAGEPVFVGMQVQGEMYDPAAKAMRLVVSAGVVTTDQSRTVRFVLDDDAVGRVLVYDLDTRAWSRDTYPAINAIVDTDDGAVMQLAALSGNFGFLRENISEDQDSVGNNPTEVASSLAWADLRPFGVAGQGRFHSAIALFAEKATPSGGYRASSATIRMQVDRFSEPGKAFTMTQLDDTDYIRVVPQYDQGTAAALSLTTSAGGWRFVGWTVEADDHGGGRRMGETEQG